jgi:hypothetical protein
MSERRDLKAEEANFPLDSFKEAAAHLRRPFAPAAVLWKPQQVTSRAMVVPFVNARLVIERLNLVIPHLWHTEYTRLDGNHMLCRLTVDGLTREDVGTPAGGGQADSVKSMYSDALKRAAVHFGIGVSLYAMKQTWLEIGDGTKNKLKRKADKSAEITPDNATWLRDMYEKWLELEERGSIFGPPLAHGDDPDAMGGLADVDEPEQTALDYTDPKEAEEQVARIREFHDSINWSKRPAGDRITKSRLNAMLSGANGDGDLDKIEAHLVERAGQGE